MATQVKHRRGTSSEINNFTPAIGELIMNVDDEGVHMGDGVTPGGIKTLNVKHTSLNFNTIADVTPGVNGMSTTHGGGKVKLRIGDRITVNDYATGHNSGVLFFKIVAAGTGTDDGGKYIDVDVNIQLEQNLRKPYSVKAWGAVGDGTYQQDKLQKAIDYVSANGGGKLHAPSGTYLIDMISFGLQMKDNVDFFGDGGQTILKGQDIDGTSNFVYVVSIAGVNDVKLRDMRIDANKPVGETDEKQWHGVRVDGDTDNTLLQRLIIVNGKGDGVWAVKNPGFGVVPKRCRIESCRFDGWNRQDIALVEGTGFEIEHCSGSGILDVESDSPSGRVNQDHYINDNEFDKIRISPLTGLGGVKTNIVAENNRCNELSTWGGDGDILKDNIVKGPIVISQCGEITFKGGSCYYIDQNVTNSTSVESLNIDNVLVESGTELIGIELKDVIDANIKAKVRLTAVGSIGVKQTNNSTQTEGQIRIECDIESESHCIDILPIGLDNTTHVVNKSRLKSTSGRSISKIGATATGKIKVIDNDIYSQPVVRYSTDLDFINNRYYGVSGINIDFNTADKINIEGERYYDTAPAYNINGQTITGNVTIRDCKGVNVVMGASSFQLTGTTAANTHIDGIETNSDAPVSGTTNAPIRSGSKFYVIDSVTKYGRWYNGTSWVDLT